MQEAKYPQQSLRILIIDDSEYSRKVMAHILEKAGYTVIGEAKNAQEATEILNNQSANLLIIDVVMPDISGIELAKYLKENFNKIYIILISSLNQEHIILEAITAGASDFLHKPFTEEDLINSVNKISEEIIQDSNLL